MFSFGEFNYWIEVAIIAGPLLAGSHFSSLVFLFGTVSDIESRTD